MALLGVDTTADDEDEDGEPIVPNGRITLQELADLGPDSVVPLDTIVGEPLTIKVNGAAIGKGEVVVCGEAYGLKVLELSANLPALSH